MPSTVPHNPHQPHQPNHSSDATIPAHSGNLVSTMLTSNPSNHSPAHNGYTPDGAAESATDVHAHTQMSETMRTAYRAVTDRVGTILEELSFLELQALKAITTEREKQLLVSAPDGELFAPMNPADFNFSSAEPPQTADDDAAGSSDVDDHEKTALSNAVPLHDQPAPDRISLLEYTQLLEEQARHADILNIRATADLVTTLRSAEEQPKIPGSQRKEATLTSVIRYVASALRLTQSTVDKRLTAASALWPDKQYRKTKLKAPLIAKQLADGKIPLTTAIAAHENLSDIRQAVRRAGADDQAAQEVVEHTEQEMTRHTARNNPHTFTRFAKAKKNAVTRELIGPRQPLSDSQIKYEKGIFYDRPVGTGLHRLSLVVDDGELLQLTAIREFATKLDSSVSALRAEAHDPTKSSKTDTGKPESAPQDTTADPDISTNQRITPEDIDLGIAQLFDGQTKAERWLNTVLDFLSSSLILHKTYDPAASAEQQQRRHEALRKAAEHSPVIADILDLDSELSDDEPPNAATPDGQPPDDPLSSLVPPGYQLLRPNLDMIIEISLRDLIGAENTPDATLREHSSEDESEIQKIAQQLQNRERGVSAPLATPGNISIDYGVARQQACHQRIIPMVLGSASQPLDVGRAQRSFSPAIRRALHVRDRGCIVPGCARPASWCEPHHIQEWAKGGSTSLDNAGLLCRHHHRAVHSEHILIHMEADGLPSCSLPRSLDPTQKRYRNIFWQHS